MSGCVVLAKGVPGPEYFIEINDSYVCASKEQFLTCMISHNGCMGKKGPQDELTQCVSSDHFPFLPFHKPYKHELFAFHLKPDFCSSPS